MFDLLASTYRATVFGVHGFFNFTKQGFESSASSRFNASDLQGVSMKGKVVVVTGANSGLGKAVTLDLAQRGATVNMVCRNAATAAQVQKEIIQETSNSNIHLRIANVASPVQLDGIVGELSAEFGKVDVLVNNAGGIYEKREQTENGVDASFATNTFATYYLTEKCMPLLLKSEDARVITVSSGGAYSVPLDPQDLEFKKMKKWDGVTAYAFSKRAQIALTEYWGGIKFDNAAEVTDATRPGNPLFLSMHPGWADTPGVEKSLSAFHRAMQGRLRTPEMGADTIIWAAVASRSVLTATGVKNGAFLFDRQPVSPHISGGLTASSHSIANLEALVENLKKYNPAKQ